MTMDSATVERWNYIRTKSNTSLSSTPVPHYN